MRHLGGVAAAHVTQRRVGVHHALVAQVAQSDQVLSLAQSVEPAATEGQRSKVLIDRAQQLLCTRLSVSK